MTIELQNPRLPSRPTPGGIPRRVRAALLLVAALGCESALLCSDRAAHAQAAPAELESATLPCTSDANLLKTARVEAPGVRGQLRVLSDGAIAVEGSLWAGNDAVVLPKQTPALRFDLGGVQELRAFLLQGDNNEEYVLEGSLDGQTFSPLWTAREISTGQGLRTRSVKLPQPLAARYLRVNPQGGDGYYSLSELQAFCQVPAAFPPKKRFPPRKYGWDAINNESMVNLKGAVALFAALLLLASFSRRFNEWRISSPLARALLVGTLTLGSLCLFWLGVIASKAKGPALLMKLATQHGSAPGWYYSAAIFFATALVVLWLCLRKAGPRLFDTLLAVVGLFCFFSWWNLGHYHFDHYVHIWEHYHYILGAKYGPELRYSRLYQCTAVADVRDGLVNQVKERKMRRIDSDNELGTTEHIITDPSLCTKHFSDAARWEDFRRDNRFFRTNFSTQRWDESQQDHGYNATPVWAIFGRWLADRTTLSWDNIVKLSLLDSGFLIAMWLAVLWAFGWRAACVALIYWGCNFPARFYWNGGSFLRYDWLLWLVLGICFLRKDRMFLGGAALTYATLLRVFPGFVVATLVLKALAAMVRERRIFLSRNHQWFAAGCIAALAVLVPASSWATNGLDAWAEFAQNSRKHLATALTNNMGLKTVMGYDYDTRAMTMRNEALEDPFKEWKNARQHFYTTRTPYFLGLIALFCLLLARAADREEDWAAACLGTGLIVIAPELTCYYYGFLLTYGLLWPRRKLPGILAAALAGFTCFIYDAFAWNDDHFAAMSLASVIVVVAATAHTAFGARAAKVEDALTAPPPKQAPELPPEPSMPPILAEPR